VKPPKTVFVCQECGGQQPKWVGRCPDCGAWNSLVEEQPAPQTAPAAANHRYGLVSGGASARLYSDIETSDAPRIPSGVAEFDRVLGGGIVPGALVLLGGEPGIGKSTLLLQVAAHVARNVGPVLYSSGEESEHQIKLRGERLAVDRSPLYLLAETCLERILEEIERLKPALVIVDSIQTIFSARFQSAPGSIGQVREVATHLLFAAKGRNVPIVLVGHVTKDGNLAGPKALEHVVDTVLYFEGERHHAHRVVRAFKNRFGAASELGVFEMTSTGLREVANPSQMFLAERSIGKPGSAVLCCIEGSRPILVEVQALVTSSTFGNARRMASGIDQQRLSLLLAVMEKRAGLHLLGDDVYINVAGGMNVDEPAADLGVVAAVASSVKNRAVGSSTAVFGEVGLGGEVRAITQPALRVREAARMGFERCVVPLANADLPKPDLPPNCELIGVRTVDEALQALLQ
jgi:DNA repair protein RadA/Sms